jgi:hypothetical protein
MRLRSLLRERHGAVVVLAAVMILPLTLLLAFAVDTGNWWVHKRHLQTQADAGALAGGLGPWLPFCDESAIESNALDYSSNGGGGQNPQYTNENNVTVLLNSTDYSNSGGSNFSDGGTPCQQLMNNSGSDTPAFLDVKANEADLPNLFGSIPGFSVVPAIHAHARVEIQQAELEYGVRPIAVRDDSAYQCGQIVLRRANPDGSAGAQYGSAIPTTRSVVPDPSGTGTDTQFQTAATQIPMPSPPQSLLVQAELGDCANPPDVFPQDDRGNPVGGLDFINVYTNGSPPGDPIVRSVTLSGGCNPDQYFSFEGDCNGTVNAIVEFASGAITSGVDQNVSVTIGGTDATFSGGVWSAPFSFSALSGPHPFDVTAHQRFGSTSKGTCNNPNRCTFDFGVQQQQYSATSDDTADSNSGAIRLVQIGCTADCGPFGSSTIGANSFERGTSPTLVFTVLVGGLQNSKPSDPPVVLRYDNQSSHRTGAVDCGQGSSGGPQLSGAVVDGCPSGIYLWAPGDTCVSPNEASAPTPFNCVVPVPGNKNGTGIIDGLKTRIANTCDQWIKYRDTGGNAPLDNARLITMIITAPADLNGGGGANVEIPVVNLAHFYISGIDNFNASDGTPGCEDEPYPGNFNKQSIKKAAVWGHWVKYAVPGGQGNGKACNVNQFGDCVAVLTR